MKLSFRSLHWIVTMFRLVPAGPLATIAKSAAFGPRFGDLLVDIPVVIRLAIQKTRTLELLEGVKLDEVFSYVAFDRS